MAETPRSITAFPAEGGPGGPADFYSVVSGPAAGAGSGPPIAAAVRAEAAGGREAKKDAVGADGVAAQTFTAHPFTAHQEALLRLTTAVPALAAGYLLLRGTEAETAEGFARAAMGHLRVWFADPATRMTPSLEFGAMLPGSSRGQFEGVLETVAMAEVAVAAAALGRSQAAVEGPMLTVRAWFGEYLDWLTTSRLAGLARDQKDHHGSSWMLQSSAYALLAGKDATVVELRHRYKTVTVRAQIVADGIFPHELTTLAPYRNSLFNLDMMAATTDLLSTRFETLWEFELQDGPGMRAVMARFFPYIERRNTWPYKSDPSHFSALPGRRPSLLFAARAYSRPEYAELWRSLPPDPTDPVVLATFPIRQPLLWVSRPRV